MNYVQIPLGYGYQLLVPDEASVFSIIFKLIMFSKLKNMAPARLVN